MLSVSGIHLQGTVCFESRKKLGQVFKALGPAHFSVARNLAQNILYCMKEGHYTEIGLN